MPINLENVFDWLSDPFHPKEVRWRVGPRNREKTKGIPLCYVDARTVMQRLDDIVGPDNWQDEYIEAPKRIICKIGIHTHNGWVWKSDGAGDTDMEGAKGGLSDSFKRAAVKFGIGRYLYGIHVGWIDLENEKLPERFIKNDAATYLLNYRPRMLIKYMECVRNNIDSIYFIKQQLAEENLSAAHEAWNELGDEMEILWKAPSFGGIFTTLERKLLDEAATEDHKLRKANG